MSRVDLPSGAWVELRDPATILVRDRHAVLRLGADTEASFDRHIMFTEARIVVAVEKWSNESHPTLEDLSPFADMTPADFVALDTLTQPHDDAMFPNFTPAGATDPKAPSATSDESNGG